MNAKSIFAFALCACIVFLFREPSGAQGHGFAFGKITYPELEMKKYDRDTSAVAVVLNEFGDAYFDMENLNVIHLEYHIKIKVLKEAGKEYADFIIPMRRNGSSRQEVVRNIKASSFNLGNNSWKETPLLPKGVFTEKSNDDYWLTKFAVPDVRVGSVIEVYYELETPYTYNFVPWKFQTEIPKVKSEFWAKYPAYYDYGITLKGFLKLTKDEGEVVKQCATFADCSLLKYGMENIPAFKEEDFMTAKKNYLSAITFELSKITHTDGRVDKVTTEWKDAEYELKQHDKFGAQIKRARGSFDEPIATIRAKEKDPLAIAKAVYDHIKSKLQWTGDQYFLTDNGVKKALETGKGNVADINLNLLGALQAADFQADPVLLSTRANGIPIKHYPVLSDFNYVIVRVKIADKYYLLDATSKLFPFGFIPERCLNGQGRAFGEGGDWIDIKPSEKKREVTDIKLKINQNGTITGQGAINHFGYSAYEYRSNYLGFTKLEDFAKERTSDWNGFEIKNFAIENENDLTKPFVEKFEIAMESTTGNADIIYFEPFLIDRVERNPFASSERIYPVDFGTPTEIFYVLNIEYPSAYEPEDLPQNVALAIPQGGGRFLLNVTKLDGKLALTCSMAFSKPIYASGEYPVLKEIYARYIATQQMQIVFKKKK